MSETSPNTLGIDGDDSMDLLIEAEAAFGIEISDDEAQAIYTVGQFHSVIADKVGDSNGEKCASSMSFYQLRRAISNVVSQKNLRPKTLLTELTNMYPRTFFKRIQNNLTLTLPDLEMTKIGNLGLTLLGLSLFSIPVSFIFANNFVLLFLLACLGILIGTVLIRIDPRAYAADQATLGGIAKQMTVHNFGQLASSGAKVRSEDIWNTLVKITAPYAMEIEASEISKSTIIMQDYADRLRAS